MTSVLSAPRLSGSLVVSGWADLAAVSDLDEVGSYVHGIAGETAVLVVRTSIGLSAVADTCSHCGEALHMGTIDGDCVVCPQRRGVFHLLDGSPLADSECPPLEMFELRVAAGRIQVRRLHP